MSRLFFGTAVALIGLMGCVFLSEIVVPDTPQPSQVPSPTPGCMGWKCTLQGVVYTGSTSPGNEMGGIEVVLSQYSNCSPTEGQQMVTTDPDGMFEFEVFIHDTDGFIFEIEDPGYVPYKNKFSGFDCLFCSCSHLEIVLEPKGEVTPEP
jgi:hypothetical protein